MTGGFLGDFVKGPLHGERPPGVELGIRLHRAIDAQTARDDAMRSSALRFGAGLRRLAPIYIDVLADHLLACRFSDYHAGELRAFTQRAYAALAGHRQWLTADAASLHERLARHDGLAANLDVAAVHRGMERIAVRLRCHDLIPAGRDALDALYPQLSEDFLTYYPRLQNFASTWLRQQQGSVDA